MNETSPGPTSPTAGQKAGRGGRFAAAMEERLRADAGRYFPEMDGLHVTVRLVRVDERWWSTLYRFDLRADGRERSVIVKKAEGKSSRLATPETDPENDRPRIGMWSEPGEILHLQHTTLSAIDAHFDAMPDSRFRTIRVLEVIPDERAFVMERVERPTLRQLLLQGGWRSRSRAPESLLAAFRNAGAWLERYQGLPRLEHTVPRRTSRTEFLASVEEFADYLVRSGCDERALESIVSRTREAALSELPEELPTGMGHGDYAPRNVLVGPAAEVTVVDTNGRWLFPVYQDVGYFLTALKTNGPQLVTRGLLFSATVMRSYEQAFLEGYSAGHPVPIVAVRLFEVQTLLSRWVAAVHRRLRAAGARSLTTRLDLAMRRGFLRSCIERALGEIASRPGRSGSPC